jgi:hypothetical protein
MNATSSRSHAIFTVIIECSKTDEEGKESFHAGKLNLVDLAGSERATKTGATGDRLKEGAKINLSLSALGNVIQSLAEGKGGHIPYRDSKLTRLLQTSLGGNTKTVMMCAVSPADYNYDETTSTLRYGNRAKNIKNKPTINEDPKDAMIREFKEEISRLKELLDAVNLSDGAGALAAAPLQASSKSTPLANVGEAEPANVDEAESSTTESSSSSSEEDDDDAAGNENNAAMPAPVRSTSARHDDVGRPVPPKPTRPAERPASRGKDGCRPSLAEVQVQRDEQQIARLKEEQQKELQAAIGQGAEQVALLKEQQQHQLQAQEELIASERASSEAAHARAAQISALRDAMQAKLEALQAKVVSANESQQKKLTADEEAAQKQKVAMARKKKELRKQRHKVQLQKRRATQLEKAKDEIHAEKEATEDALKQVQLTAEAKMAAAMAEMEDFRAEKERERDLLLETIREQKQYAKLLEQVVDQLVTPSEMRKVWEQAVWKEEDETWDVPKFRAAKRFERIKHHADGSVSGGVIVDGQYLDEEEPLPQLPGLAGIKMLSEQKALASQLATSSQVISATSHIGSWVYVQEGGVAGRNDFDSIVGGGPGSPAHKGKMGTPGKTGKGKWEWKAGNQKAAKEKKEKKKRETKKASTGAKASDKIEEDDELYDFDDTPAVQMKPRRPRRGSKMKSTNISTTNIGKYKIGQQISTAQVSGYIVNIKAESPDATTGPGTLSVSECKPSEEDCTDGVHNGDAKARKKEKKSRRKKEEEEKRKERKQKKARNKENIGVRQIISSLNKMKQMGVLNDVEYAAAKRKVLADKSALGVVNQAGPLRPQTPRSPPMTPPVPRLKFEDPVGQAGNKATKENETQDEAAPQFLDHFPEPDNSSDFLAMKSEFLEDLWDAAESSEESSTEPFGDEE